MFSVALGIFSFHGFGVFHWPIQWFRTTQPLDTGFDALINNSTKYRLYGCAALEDDGKCSCVIAYVKILSADLI